MGLPRALGQRGPCERPAGVEVTAQQFAWEFTNREAGIASGDMRVPAGRQVELEMRSKDVIHDFYVKEFRVKQDVVPGHHHAR